MDSLLLTDTVSHVLTAVKHAQQPMEPLPTNVKAATQASVSTATECANHATHHARPVQAAGKPIPAQPAMKTPPWEHLDIVSVTSLRFVSSPAGLVKTTVQVVPFSTHPQEHVLMVIIGENLQRSHSKSITNSKTDSQHSTLEQILKALRL
jgi:hypothetical protein